MRFESARRGLFYSSIKFSTIQKVVINIIVMKNAMEFIREISHLTAMRWRLECELSAAQSRIAELEELNARQVSMLMESVMTEPEQKEWIEQHKI